MGNDSIDQILKLGRLVGTRNMINYIRQNRLFERKGNHICADLIIASQNGDIREEQPTKLSDLVNESNKHNATSEAISLVSQLLTIDFRQRPTAREAL